jgi:hypothetical protein
VGGGPGSGGRVEGEGEEVGSGRVGGDEGGGEAGGVSYLQGEGG